ncbi:putative 2og-fe oxygenase protein [Botrytis fragariae]|uniref:Putative 2og-fe oxygenase protein n=1 Tax=Botrytis fragariae TaxID=1964551 RepID=A0A8H6EMM7_9HELO|nr:putative 2og-fe oxygenase protein [Botrytis fragariae]KAF5877848.1 putative 2og-fe oxygenase protein [Botrytis fragariae]
MFDITASTLTLDYEVLKKYAYQPPKVSWASGVLKTDDGKLDNIALYSIGQEDILGISSPCANPLQIEAHREEYNFVLLSRPWSSEQHLGLAPGTLESLNSLDKESKTSLRMLLSRPQTSTQNHRVTLGGHTDIRTITMLFNIAGGLHVLPSSAENRNENWQYIRPVPGCALIDIRDTMVKWTGRILRSSLHRVVTAPGNRAGVTRQSLGYLVRSGKNASVKRLEGKRVIPRLEGGEQEEERGVSEWSAWGAMQIIKGGVETRYKVGEWWENSMKG